MASTAPTRARRLLVRQLGMQDYVPVWRAMQAFTAARDAASGDELWVLEHPAVFTLGQAARAEHVIGDTGAIPVIRVDRGGQVTYHGPGQVVVYVLLDLRRLGIGVRRLVSCLEQSVVRVLAEHGVGAAPRADAPGVYVGARKIAALGLRVRRGCSYHGLSLNAHMDLAPFALIDPCGYAGLQVTQAHDLGVDARPGELAAGLVRELASDLGYNAVSMVSEPPDRLVAEQGTR